MLHLLLIKVNLKRINNNSRIRRLRASLFSSIQTSKIFDSQLNQQTANQGASKFKSTVPNLGVSTPMGGITAIWRT